MLESILDTAIENLSFEKGCVKFGFSERATKFEKNLHRTFDKSVVICAKSRQRFLKTNVDKSYYTNCLKLIYFEKVIRI